MDGKDEGRRSSPGPDSKSSKFLNVAETTNDAYAAAAQAVLAQATGAFAKLFAANAVAK